MQWAFLFLPVLINIVILYAVYILTRRFYHPQYPPVCRGRIPSGVAKDVLVPLEGYENRRRGGVSVKVRSWEPDEPNGVGILFIHGWESSMGYFANHIEHYLDLGFTVCAVDALSHGESDYCHVISFVNVTDSIEAARQWMVSQYTLDKLILWGHSLGGVGSTIGVGTGVIEGVNLMVIEGIYSDSRFIIKRYLNSSPFPNSIARMFLWMVKRIFISTLPPDHPLREVDIADLNPSNQILNIQIPYILIHAKQDHVVNYSEFERMLEVAGDRIDPIPLDEGNHFTTHKQQGYFEIIDSKINQYLSIPVLFPAAEK